MAKLPLVLFFIASSSPTAEEELAAAEIVGCRVAYRNAKMVSPDASVETCDAVAGAVPANYEDLPTPEEAVAKRKAELEAATKRRDDELAESKVRDNALLLSQAKRDVIRAQETYDKAAKNLADKEAFVKKLEGTVEAPAQAAPKAPAPQPQQAPAQAPKPAQPAPQAAPVQQPPAPQSQPQQAPTPAPAQVQQAPAQAPTGQAPVTQPANAGWTPNS